MRVLIAPDKFRGTLTAEEAAWAMAAGWLRVHPEAAVDVVPLADGGEGSVDALVAALGGRRHRAGVTGPLGDQVSAEYGLLPGSEGPVAVIEMARASGLALVTPTRLDPKRATTRGTGELIMDACRRGARHFLVCLGGSATNDAGAGMAQAVGIRLFDRMGGDLRPGGAALLDLTRVDLSRMAPEVRESSFIAATDVDNPLVGPTGASAVYGPQKGASRDDVALLDRALAHFAAVVYRDLGIDVRTVPGAGAAGGLGAGLVGFLGAKVRPGVDVVMDAVGLEGRMAEADVVLTGEGAFDRQSMHGKVPAGVLRVARELGVPAFVLCGQATAEPAGATLLSLADRFGVDAAMERPRALLEDLAAEAAQTFAGG